MATPPMTHAQLISRFADLAWERGCYVHFCTDGRRCEGPGLPDLIIAGPRGVIYREVKSDAAPQLRDDQRAWMRMLAASGQDARTWRHEDLINGRAERELNTIAGTSSV